MPLAANGAKMSLNSESSIVSSEITVTSIVLLLQSFSATSFGQEMSKSILLIVTFAFCTNFSATVIQLKHNRCKVFITNWKKIQNIK